MATKQPKHFWKSIKKKLKSSPKHLQSTTCTNTLNRHTEMSQIEIKTNRNRMQIPKIYIMKI